MNKKCIIAMSGGGDSSVAAFLMKEKGYEFFMDSNTNQQFIIVEDAKLQEIRQKYGVTYQERYDETHSVIRLCTSWATKEENVKAFLQDM